jgi:hypothetical protein
MIASKNFVWPCSSVCQAYRFTHTYPADHQRANKYWQPSPSLLELIITLRRQRKQTYGKILISDVGSAILKRANLQLR